MNSVETTSNDCAVMSELIKSLAKERYDFEYQRSQAINSRVELSITIFVVLFGAIVFFFRELPVLTLQNFFSIIFILFFVASFISLLIVIYFLGCLLFGFAYEYIPLPSKYKTYEEKMKAYYGHEVFKQLPEDEKRCLIETKIQNHINENYEKAAEFNFKNNNTKAMYLLFSNRALIIAVIFLAITAILYFPVSQLKKTDITQLKTREGLMSKKDVMLPIKQG